jgi:hypothetical protein
VTVLEGLGFDVHYRLFTAGSLSKEIMPWVGLGRASTVTVWPEVVQRQWRDGLWSINK